MTNAIVLSLSVNSASLDYYNRAIKQIPILSAEEEFELAQRLRQHNDLEAARLLIMAHLRFVAHIARSYNGYGLQLADLIQEGNIGLMKAVKRFDPDKKVRLVSFAVHWIRAEIHEYILRNWRIVRVATTKAQRKLFFNLRSSKQRLGWFNQDEARAVAEDLGVPLEQVMEMEQRMSASDTAFDAPTSDDDEHNSPSPAYYLEDKNADPMRQFEQADHEARVTRLQHALGTLDDRSRDILASRWLSDDKATLHDLAARHQVSAERIRQLESSAIKKLKQAMEA